MHQNEELINRFYTAFARRDGDAMAACYHADVEFSDPVFTDLRGARAGAMWKMLCSRSKDLRIEHSNVTADDTTGSAHWEAWYTFAQTGKKVHNPIDATFEFKDGLIIRHTDDFDFKAWASQALGLVGKIAGGTGFLKKKARALGATSLDRYVEKHGE